MIQGRAYPINKWNRNKYKLFSESDPRIKIDEPSGCWIWQQTLDDDGYGVAWRDNKTVRAHKAFYEQKYGLITDPKTHLHHNPTCTAKACCNPDHLTKLTNSEHNKLEKGMLHPLVSEELVQKIREDYGEHTPEGIGRSHKRPSMEYLSIKYNVSMNTIFCIVSKRGRYACQ